MRVFLYSGYDFYKKQCKYYKNNRPDDPASVFHNHACPCIMSCNRKYRCCNSKHDHDLSAEQKYHKSRYIGRKVGNLHGTGRFCHTHFSKSCIQKQEKGSCPGAIKTIIAAHSKKNTGHRSESVSFWRSLRLFHPYSSYAIHKKQLPEVPGSAYNARFYHWQQVLHVLPLLIPEAPSGYTGVPESSLQIYSYTDVP